MEVEMPSDERQYKRLDQYKNFFDATTADEQDEYYGPIRPLIGSETSSSNIEEREDLPSFIKIATAVQEMFANGQDDLALQLQTTYTVELQLTRSIGGHVLEHIFSNKMEYSQTQNVHEYMHPPEKKKGLFR